MRANIDKMINREKVIKGLTFCTTINKANPVETCGKCPYFIKDNESDVGCIDILMLDTLKLLKEQESHLITEDEYSPFLSQDALELLREREPAKGEKTICHGLALWVCSACDTAITEGDKFCRKCGRKVKWDE